MSAEFELLRVPRLNGSRKLARLAKPLVDSAATDISPETVRPDMLMAAIGRMTFGYKQKIKIGDRKEDVIDDYFNEPPGHQLLVFTDKTLKRHLTKDQLSVLLNNIAPHFECSPIIKSGTFSNSYGLCVGFMSRLETSAFSVWPIAVEDMFLTGIEIDNIEPFTNALMGVAEDHQPFLNDFVQGLSVNHHTSRMSRCRIIEVSRIASAGVGLACLQLSHFNNQNAAEMSLNN